MNPHSSPTLKILGVVSTFLLLTACTPTKTENSSSPIKNETTQPSSSDPITAPLIDKLVINANQGRILEPFQAKLGASKQEIESALGKPPADSSEKYYSYDLKTHHVSFTFQQDKVSSIMYHWNQESSSIPYQDVIKKLGETSHIIKDKGTIQLTYTIKSSTVTFVFPMHQNQNEQKLTQYSIHITP
ncbi:DUF4309 domain-containing protein [Thermoactinomyces sp. DSM 45892]|uniref:DUF4309 domain-containing protein n=1 Tax=Thermoactinomyces sp. DSM 45892 TaxID=1882753 RepID=UPI0008988CD6|nr:DUF4309 domain-containing protein [Thermoactinomyces sp. DSM 45892]SDZ16530.1 protein of unknown function [Thermoactinomyces sp. DSM 45892]